MKIFTAVIVAVFLCVSCAFADSVGDAVNVRVITDDGRTLPIYPVKMRHGLKKVYAEANRGDQYRIQVTNRLNRRIGLVIAVDGRNIISGTKSNLQNSERMYILEPYASGEFSGWRTSQDRVNRFYFTDVADSYAAAFGDKSAMGIIAVAVYREVKHFKLPTPWSTITPATPGWQKGKTLGEADKNEAGAAAPSASNERMLKSDAVREQVLESAGTGYGHEEYSPSEIVMFEPEKRAAENIFLKYEWRSTLCKLGVVKSHQSPCRPYNRFWNDNGYAPPPPERICPAEG